MSYIAFIPKTCTSPKGRGQETIINAWVDERNKEFEEIPFTGHANGNTYRKQALDYCRKVVVFGPYPFLNISCKKVKP